MKGKNKLNGLKNKTLVKIFLVTFPTFLIVLGVRGYLVEMIPTIYNVNLVMIILGFLILAFSVGILKIKKW